MSEEETVEEVADKLFIEKGRLGKKILPISPAMQEKLKKGELKVVPVTAEGPIRKPAEQAFEPALSPEEIMEQRYVDSVERAKKMHDLADKNKPGKALPALPLNVAKATKDVQATHNMDKPTISQYLKPNNRLKKKALCKRPVGAPSILEECAVPVHLHVSQHQSPGDLVMLSAAIRDLHVTYPGKFITSLRTPCMHLWQSNPYHQSLPEDNPDAMWLPLDYPIINQSNEGAYHFIHGFRKDIEDKLGLPINQGPLKGDIYITPEEKMWHSQMFEILKTDVPYWIINAGHKKDFTAKMWEHTRYQAIVEAFPDIIFAQVGQEAHIHKPLVGKNVVNLIGKTDMRQLIRLMYHSAGVITPVSFAMHLAAAVEMHPRYRRKTRPCIVIAGGREPAIWEAYTNHQYLHTCGMLPCCESGGCWRSRVQPLFDGDQKDKDRLCERPIVTKSGQVIPQCMAMIPVEEVLDKMDNYLEAYNYSGVVGSWHSEPFTIDPKLQEDRKQAIAGKKK